MKHKTWFRLVIKAIGILLIALAAPRLVITIAQWALDSMELRAKANAPLNQFTGAWPTPRLWTWAFAEMALQTAIGAYLLLAGQALVNLCIPSNRPYCHDCGYDLSRASGPSCPECGVVITAETRIAESKND